jgi:hypothetical protein
LVIRELTLVRAYFGTCHALSYEQFISLNSWMVY